MLQLVLEKNMFQSPNNNYITQVIPHEIVYNCEYSGCLRTNNKSTPLKIKMEPKNHPALKRIIIWTKPPCLRFHVTFAGCIRTRSNGGMWIPSFFCFKRPTGLLNNWATRLWQTNLNHVTMNVVLVNKSPSEIFQIPSSGLRNLRVFRVYFQNSRGKLLQYSTTKFLGFPCGFLLRVLFKQTAFSSWWLNQPTWKICSFSQGSGWI